MVPLQEVQGRRDLWVPASLPCWGSTFLSDSSFCVWNTEALIYEISKSSCFKSFSISCFIITERNEQSSQNRFSLLLILGLAPQCLSPCYRQPFTHESVQTANQSISAHHHLSRNNVQTCLSPSKSSERPNLNSFHQGQMSVKEEIYTKF